MKPVIFLTALLTLGLAAHGQTKIEKRIVAQPGQKLVMDFEWPKLIKIQTWDQKDILVKGDVSINKGENDNAFELSVSQTSGEIRLSSMLKDEANIPRRVVINVDGMEYMFKANDMNDPEVQKFLQEKGQHYSYTSNGIIREIVLEIFVPKGMETTIDAKFGLVEIKSFQAPLKASSEFGGVDASITERTTGELTARTEFGEILTNLDVKFNTDKPDHHRDRITIISAKPGAGPRYDFESKFGKVYLRKSEN